MSLRVVVAGVGGQGTLLASRVLAESALRAGLHVMIGETYGMAQRGGPVMGHIQLGCEARNPQLRPATAQALLGFEPAEAVRRGVSYLEEGGLALVNTRRVNPVEVVSGQVAYPSLESLLGLLSRVTKNIHAFDATALAEKAGNPIATNMVMVGALAESGLLPFPLETVVETIREVVPSRFLDLNLKAFQLGQEAFHSQT